MKTSPKPLSPKQHAMLSRAASGEDRQLPERAYCEGGRVTFVMPARRWFVPPGLLVPAGAAEYAAARALAAKGLVRPGGVGPSPELPCG